MFRHFTLAIFRLRSGKNLVSSYTQLMWVVYSGEVRDEVGMLTKFFPFLNLKMANVTCRNM